MAQIVQVRKSVDLFCTILQENGFSKYKAETLRLAKFNNDGACSSMWKLLFELIIFSEYGAINEDVEKQFERTPKNQIVHFVKASMWDRGYLVTEFFELHDYMASGSRMLLHAIGWFMCRDQTLEQLMKMCADPLEHDTSRKHETSFDEDPLEEPDVQSDVSLQLEQLLYLNHQLQLQLKELNATGRENALLQHKMYEATYRSGSADSERNHLTLLEIHLLRHPELLQQNLDVLARDNLRLDHLLSWSSHESVFWKWMESTLDDNVCCAKAMIGAGDGAEPGMVEPEWKAEATDEARAKQAVDTGTHNVGIMFGLNELDGTFKNLEKSIDKYEKIIDRFTNQVSDVDEDVVDAMLQSIESELSLYKSDLERIKTSIDTKSCGDGSCRDGPFQRTRFILDKSTGAKLLPHQTNWAQHPDTPTNIQEAIEMIKQATNDLQKKSNAKQTNLEQQMSELSERLCDVLVIPPMSNRKTNKGTNT